jgi:hypothetical protein
MPHDLALFDVGLRLQLLGDPPMEIGPLGHRQLSLDLPTGTLIREPGLTGLACRDQYADANRSVEHSSAVGRIQREDPRDDSEAKPLAGDGGQTEQPVQDRIIRTRGGHARV